MWQLITNVLRNAFTIALIFTLNYVLLIGVRDILYFVRDKTLVLFGRGPRKRRRKRIPIPDYRALMKVLYRIIFWAVFVCAAFFFFYFLLPVCGFVMLAYFVFRAAEKKRISPNRLIAVCAALLALAAFAFIRSQPVLLKIDRQFSVDLWIYNASNSLIDTMLEAGRRLHVNTGGIVRLEALVPWIQENIASLIFLSLYVFSGAFITRLARAVLPDTKFEAPAYHRIAPVREFGVIAVLLLAAAHYLHAPQLTFAVAGIYYLWGVNMLIYALRGGQWALNVFIAAAGALNPPTIAFFIALGALDNLFDLRRMAAVFGLVNPGNEPGSR